jgi:SAM-dependent methyltransferase
MDRVPEPELMDDPIQARAYATADFEAPHRAFVELLRERFPHLAPRSILDLGCGPGDISRRLARTWPEARVLGIDGATEMLEAGRALADQAQLAGRVELRLGLLPGATLPSGIWDAVVSNSLLHHLRDPLDLWRAIREVTPGGAAIFVMDLRRPGSSEAVDELVGQYAGDEPAVLREDFRNSLFAAYRRSEIEDQLSTTGLSHLTVEEFGDRHLVVWGRADG